MKNNFLGLKSELFTKILRCYLPWFKYHITWSLVRSIPFPKNEAIRVLAGVFKYPYRIHSSRMTSPTSSMLTISFLKIGWNWANFFFKWSGTAASHTTNPNNSSEEMPAIISSWDIALGFETNWFRTWIKRKLQL